MKKPRFKHVELKGMPLQGGRSRSQVPGLTDSLALALSSLSQAEQRGRCLERESRVTSGLEASRGAKDTGCLGAAEAEVIRV